MCVFKNVETKRCASYDTFFDFQKVEKASGVIFESKVVKYDEDGGTGLVLVSEEPEALFVIGIVTNGVSR